MKTADLLALCNNPLAGHWSAFERRSAVIATILATLVFGTALIDAYMPRADAFVPGTAVSKNLDRGSTLANSLPVLD
jgi:hypothetical protein